jgi:hypothetical protein
MPDQFSGTPILLIAVVLVPVFALATAQKQLEKIHFWGE